LVNVETQALNTIADRDPGGGGSGGGSGAPSRTQPAPSPDGRRVFFVTGRGVAVRDLASGVETDVVTTPGVTRFALSPDSRSLAITQTADDSKHLFVVPASGGEPRILAAAEGWTINGVTWMADSRSLLVVRPGARGPEIWQVPVDGAPPRSTGISWSGTIERISAHPDGRRLAVSTEQVSSETWVLQNIPGPPAKK
jgi:TolB protein